MIVASEGRRPSALGRFAATMATLSHLRRQFFVVGLELFRPRWQSITLRQLVSEIRFSLNAR